MRQLNVMEVIKRLRKLYKPPKTFLDFDTPFQLLIATMLSAQSTDAQVNIITKSLFKKYRSPKDFLKAPLTELEKDIRSSGHYHSKARYIRGTCHIMLEKFGGDVPQNMEELIQFPGVGRKTAACVLHAAFNKAEGIAVDTHVIRLSQRLGLTRYHEQSKIELDLMKATPKKDWNVINTLLISHGRSVCTARNRKCDQCVFQKDCPSSWVMGKKDRARKR